MHKIISFIILDQNVVIHLKLLHSIQPNSLSAQNNTLEKGAKEYSGTFQQVNNEKTTQII